jgi:hypothetical protein
MTLDDFKAAVQKASNITMPSFSVHGDVVSAEKMCTETGLPYQVEVSLAAYQSWRRGMLAQRAFPELSADQREFIMSGTTPAEWLAVFPDGEEEDY